MRQRGTKRSWTQRFRSALSLREPSVRYSLLVLAATLGTFAAAPAPASAEACASCKPWWHLTSSVLPAKLQPGAGHDEAQALKVVATSGDVVVEGPGEHLASFPWNATSEEVQGVLEGLFGAHNVQVTGGPGDATGSKPYLITFQGALSEDREAPVTNPVLSVEACIRSLGECLKDTAAVGELGEASTTVATPAAPDGTIVVTADNLGDADAPGVTLADRLPPGVTVLEEHTSFSAAGAKPEVEFLLFPLREGEQDASFFCAEHIVGNLATCTLPEGEDGGIEPYEDVEMRISVRSSANTEEERAEASGGGAAPVQLSHPIPVGAGAPAFGVEHFEEVVEEADGSPDVQAGSHPFALTTTLALNQTANPIAPPALTRALQFNLPAGLVGNATSVPQCTEAQFSHIVHQFGNSCPQGSAIGVAVVSVVEPIHFTRMVTVSLPVFNLVPVRGEPARFGFDYLSTPVTIDTSVRTGSDYGVTASVSNITELANFVSETVSFWGVPGDPRHNASRGNDCIHRGSFGTERDEPCQSTSEVSSAPFLTLPTSCSAPFRSSVEGESWPFKAGPGSEPESVKFAPGPQNEYSLQDASGAPLAITGCNQLAFGPSIEARPDVQQASTATGLKVDVKVPQEVNENAEGLASSSVKDITVGLPPGVQVNPAGGNGLEACTTKEVGFEGTAKLDPTGEPENETDLFSPTLPEPLEPGTNLGALGFCPNASKIGTARIFSPLIRNPVVGSVYLASQNANPFGSLLATYIVAEDPVSGTIVKLPGKVSLCEAAGQVLAGMTCQASGQLITTFLNNPQVPFEDAELHFFGGERAPLATPAHCGVYTTNATFTPWSGGQPVGASSSFQITSGPNGNACAGASLPFSPSLTGGTMNINAGSFTPLTTTIGRADGDQDIQSVRLHMPAGLEGLLSTVKLCPEAQANEGACGPESLIGETTVEAGVGSDPVSVTGGRVYLTEKYAGAPFGLSIVNPVKAGPFDLEHDTANPANQPPCDCLVVRAKIEVNPHTAELTITTDESGPHAIPHLIDGVPVQIQKVNVLINREHFTFNPTNCDPMSLTGTIAGDEGASQLVEERFQVTNCAVLKFEPKVSVTTAGHASKRYGETLNFKISYPKGAMGSDSWFKEAKFDIPKQLPAELKAIQQACLAHTFETDRTACPVHSIIGHAIVHTEVLPVPLEGPVYFVSYGGQKFPDAVLVLSGYGITVELIGETFIDNKTGVTSATFPDTPDVPFESIEVNVPAGEYSEFGSNLPHESYDFCGQKLKMPTLFKAQNGLEIHEETPVSVTGCSKAKTRTQRLAAALRACHKQHGGKRSRCEHLARKKYGPTKRRK